VNTSAYLDSIGDPAGTGGNGRMATAQNVVTAAQKVEPHGTAPGLRAEKPQVSLSQISKPAGRPTAESLGLGFAIRRAIGRFAGSASCLG
jgi:hypothetical protein